MRNLPQAERLLRDAALRVTAPRTAVLSAVHDHPHADTETLLAATRARLGSVSHQAVYDVLRVLTDVGLIRRRWRASELRPRAMAWCANRSPSSATSS